MGDIKPPAGVSCACYPGLGEVVGQITAQSNAKLSIVAFPKLRKVSWLIVQNNPGLSTLSFPMLSDVSEGLSVSNNTNLPTVAFPALRAMTCGLQTLQSNAVLPLGLIVENNAKLSTIDFPLLREVSCGLNVNNNPNLPTVAFPLLQEVLDGLNVQSNANLETVSFPALSGERRTEYLLQQQAVFHRVPRAASVDWWPIWCVLSACPVQPQPGGCQPVPADLCDWSYQDHSDPSPLCRQHNCCPRSSREL